MSNVGGTLGPIFQVCLTLAALALLVLFIVKMVPVGIAMAVTMLAISGYVVLFKDRAFWQGVFSKLFK